MVLRIQLCCLPGELGHRYQAVLAEGISPVHQSLKGSSHEGLILEAEVPWGWPEGPLQGQPRAELLQLEAGKAR